ncbi:MAG: hypothetical protein AUH29_12330 [Candidatus Rokubacteria bacterium 13_1_40CM_69_27]|nr:MAG: hypothetical protein AUH29_12330 [Candidatus Rokubacteria bacterium 13_1_40CM_69_27]OLE36393.1 MAG: hypothetical protein AUG00_10835 [Candidatus Rokubacteria bacterium 13_1_20CM_2_70_7]
MIHLETVLGGALLAGAWTGAWIVRGERPSAGRSAALVAGLLAFGVALNGPLHDLAERSRFSAHMAQHLLLTLIAPSCLLAAAPAWMVDGLLAPLRRVPWLNAVARVSTRAIPALALYAAALVAWHLPGPFGAALESHAWHIVEHAALTGTALLAWWPVLSSSRLFPALPYGAQLLYLFAFGMPMTVVAAMITGAEEVLYPFYAEAARATGMDPLADQRLGGILMWVPAGVVPLVAFTIVFFRWAAAEADDVAEGMDCPK